MSPRLTHLRSKQRKNVGFLTRARLESRNVPSTVAWRRISPPPFIFFGGGLGGGPRSRHVRHERSPVSACAREYLRGAVLLGLARKSGIGEEKCLLRRVAWSFRGAGGESGRCQRVAGSRIGVSRGRRGESWNMCVCARSMVDVHFACQAWGTGCMWPLGQALGGGSAWQVWRLVHFDVAARAFRMAGVGNGGHRGCCARGFA